MVNPFAWGKEIDYEKIFGDDIDIDSEMMKIWRIYYFDLEVVDTHNWGQLHDKDCYLLLRVSKPHTDLRGLNVHERKVAEGRPKLLVSIHYWIGPESTLDKQGSVAMYAVMLNMYLGGVCRLVRELGGFDPATGLSYESQQFLDYFDGDIEYLMGGTESGFLPIEDIKHEPRLYQLQRVLGRDRNRYISRRVPLTGESLNQTDVFILEVRQKKKLITSQGEILVDNNRLFLWEGSLVDRVHRHNGLEFLHKLNNFDHRGGAQLILLREGEEGLDYTLNYEWQLFWQYLKGRVEITPHERKFDFLLIQEEDLVDLPAPITSITLVGTWDTSVPVPLIRNPVDGEIWWECRLSIPQLGAFTYQYKVRLENGQTLLRTDSDRGKMTDRAGIDHNKLRVTDHVEPELLFFRIHSADGKMQVSPLAQISYRYLRDRDNCYIMDAKTEVFLWIGKNASPSHRQFARAVATMLTKKPFKFAGQEHPRPMFCSVVSVLQSAEPLAFRSKFADWIETPLPPRDLTKPFANPYHAPLARLLDDPPEPDEVFDSPVTVDLLDAYTPQALEFMQQAASADAKVLQTQIIMLANPQKNMEALEIIPPQEHGIFHSGNCYLVMHTYLMQSVRNAKPRTILYFWQGREASSSPVRSWPKWILSRTLPDLRKRRGKKNVVPILIKEQCEPKHFTSLFPDNLLIIKRGVKSVLRRRTQRKVVLYDVRQTGPSRMHAIEVPAEAGYLHSRSSFVLQVPTMVMVWFGRASSDHENALAEKLAAKLKQERTIKYFDEGDEPDEWFDVLDELPYAKAVAANDNFKHDAVLYNCTCSNGWFEVYKIGAFHQGALNPSGVYILDAYRDLFLWCGPDSSESIRRMAGKWAEKFSDFLCEERDIDLFVEVVTPGKEVLHFTQYAHAWNPALARAQWVDPAVLTRQRLEQLLHEDYLIQWKHAKEQRQALQLARIRHQKELENSHHPFHKIDWSIELSHIGIYLPSLAEMTASSTASTPTISSAPTSTSQSELPAGWTPFKVNADALDVIPLAITLYGSWNNFSGNTMAKKGATYVCALDIPVGRYTYRYEVATMEELVYIVDDANPVIMRPPPAADSVEKSQPYSEDAGAEAVPSTEGNAASLVQFNALHIRASTRPLGQLELEALRRQEQESDDAITIKSLKELEEEAEQKRQEEEAQRAAAQLLKADDDEIDKLVQSRRKQKDEAELEKELRLAALRERRKKGEASAASQLDPKYSSSSAASDISLDELEARKASRRERANAPPPAAPVEDVLNSVASRAAQRRAAREGAVSQDSVPGSSDDSTPSRRALRQEDSPVTSSSSELEELEKRRQERNARRAARNL